MVTFYVCIPHPCGIRLWKALLEDQEKGRKYVMTMLWFSHQCPNQ